MSVLWGRLTASPGAILLTASIGALPALAQSEPTFFATRLYPLLESAQCRACHSQEGVASATRVHFPEKEATQNQIQLFGLSLAPLVDRANPSNSLLLNKPTNRIPHTGGERIHSGSEEERRLNEWIRYLASTTEDKLADAGQR